MSEQAVQVDDYKVLFTVGTAIFAILSAWFAVKYGQKDNEKALQELKEDLKRIDRENAKQWQHSDRMNREVGEASTEIKYLRRDVDEMRRKPK